MSLLRRFETLSRVLAAFCAFVLLWGCSSESLDVVGGKSQAVVSCDGIAAYQSGTTYAPAARIRHNGSLYECKPWPASGWCQSSGYEPGIGAAWQDAWALIDSCAGEVPNSGGTNSGGASSGSGGAGTGGTAGSVSLPTEIERVLGFEAPLSDWTASNGADLGVVPSTLEGSFAVSVGGTATWTELTSSALNWPGVPDVDTAGIDVFIPSGTSEPGWWGTIALKVSIPSQNYLEQFGSQTLDESALDRYRRIEFHVSNDIQQLLAQAHPDLRFIVEVNRASGTAAYQLDRLSLFSETEAPISGTAPSVRIDRVLSFESLADWQLSNGTATLGTDKTDGEYTLQVSNAGYVDITSQTRVPSLNEVASSLSVDVKMPQDEPNPWWHGHLGLSVHLPSQGIQWRWVGTQSLEDIAPGTWGTVQFALPSDLVSKLNSNYSDLRFKFSLNVPPAQGTYELDNIDLGQPRMARSDDLQVIEIALPEGLSLHDVAIAPSGVASRYSSVEIQTYEGPSGSKYSWGVKLNATNVRSGESDSYATVIDRPWFERSVILQSSHVGSVWTSTALELDGASTVHGDVHARAPTSFWDVPVLSRPTGSPVGAVLGVVHANDRTSWANVAGWTIERPSGGLAQIVRGGETKHLEPGNYGLLNVWRGGTLTLAPGNYSFKGLNVGGTLTVQNGSGTSTVRVDGPFQVYGFGRISADNVQVNNVAFVHFGTNTAYLNSSEFHGLFLSPDGYVVSGETRRAKITGAIFARGVSLGNTDFTHLPFTRGDCAAAETSCGELFGCEIVDTDRDGIRDCEEIRDQSPWTDPAVFNGVRATNGYTGTREELDQCTGFNSRSQLSEFFDDEKYDQLDQYAGWDFSYASGTGCHPNYGFAPHFNDCSGGYNDCDSPDEGWAAQSTGSFYAAHSGKHCFDLSGLADMCRSFSVGSEAATVDDGTTCFDLAAGIHPIHWAMGFFVDDCRWQRNDGFHLKYCFGGDDECIPSERLPSSLLRPTYNDEPLDCENETRCSVGCPCEPGETCREQLECGEGLVCGADNGQYFAIENEASASANACWLPGCESQAVSVGCGASDDTCGECPNSHPPCETNDECGPDQVCGNNNGQRFNSRAANVCWSSSCEDTVAEGACGSTLEPCGECACVPSCEGKSCGEELADGCGGRCEGVCGPGDVGCLGNRDCAAGTLCVGATDTEPGSCVEEVCAQAVPESEFCENEGSACPECECDGPCQEVRAGVRRSSFIQPDTTVGALAGAFDVGASGNATYAVSIQAPPGRGGFTPELGLTYSDGVPDGPMGPGWAISGLSQIERCSHTVALDGYARPPRFNSSDEYCIDGERLVLHSFSPVSRYRQYRPESHPLIRVEEFYDASGRESAAYFKVTTPDGIQTFYGENGNSRVWRRGGDLGEIKSWLVSRRVDGFDNQIQFKYLNRRGSRQSLRREETRETTEVVLSEVTYAPDRKITFEYQPRDEIAGAGLKVRRGFTHSRDETRVGLALVAISTDASGLPGMSYQLAYSENLTPMQTGARLERIYECGNDGVCKKPTEFTYDWGPAPQVRSVDLPAMTERPIVADVNGDRCDDLLIPELYVPDLQVYARYGMKTWGLRVYLCDLENSGPGHEFVLGTLLKSDVIKSNSGPPCFGSSSTIDMDGDGAEEVVNSCGNGLEFQMWKFNSAGTATESKLVLGPRDVWGYGSRLQFADLNGDGYKDAIALPLGVERKTRSWSSASLKIRLFDPTSRTFPASGEREVESWPLPPHDDRNLSNFVFLELDGDAGVEIARQNRDAASGEVFWETSEGILPDESATGFTFKRSTLDVEESFFYADGIIGDFNGDGLSDIFSYAGLHPETARAKIWNARNLTLDAREVNVLLESFYYDNHRPSDGVVVDIDSDGRAEFIDARNGRAYGQEGDSFIKVADVSSYDLLGGSFVVQGDFNGDGAIDLLESSGQRLVLTKMGTLGALERVLDGFGKEIRIERRADAYTTTPDCEVPGVAQCLTRPRPLVSRVEVGARLAGTFVPEHSSRYSYTDLRRRFGHGQSFGPTRRTERKYDDAGQLRSTTIIDYHNDSLHLAGRVRKSRVELAPLAGPGVEGVYRYSETLNGWETKQTPDNRPVAWLASQKVTVTQAEPGNSGDKETLFERSSDYQSNGYGLRRKDTSTWTRPGSGLEYLERRETTTTFETGTAFMLNWRIGVPESIKIVSDRPGSPARVRLHEFETDPVTGHRESATKGAASAPELVTRWTPDEFGNVIETTQGKPGGDTRVYGVEFDPRGMYPISRTNPAGHVEGFEFDEVWGLPVT